MRVLFAVAVAALLVAPLALGGEVYLGTITHAGDAGRNAVHNLTQPDAGFPIGPGTRISVQPSDYAYICVDSQYLNAGKTTCSATNGVLVPGGALFLSSCQTTGPSVLCTVQDLQADGGFSVDGGGTSSTVSIRSCTVAAVSYDGGAMTTKVFSRLGNESN